MANLYGQRGTVLLNKIDDEYLYYMLCFYTGDFETVRRVSINPQGSLGWSTSFIQYGIVVQLSRQKSKTFIMN